MQIHFVLLLVVFEHFILNDFNKFQVLPQSSSNSAGATGDNATLAAAQSAMVMGGGSGGGLKNTLHIPGVSKSRATSGESIAVYHKWKVVLN